MSIIGYFCALGTEWDGEGIVLKSELGGEGQAEVGFFVVFFLICYSVNSPRAAGSQWGPRAESPCQLHSPSPLLILLQMPVIYM